MWPEKVLTWHDYGLLASFLLESSDWGEFLSDCEDAYMEINHEFYRLILKVIKDEITKEYRVLNELLLEDEKLRLKELNRDKLEKLKLLYDFVEDYANKSTINEQL